MIDQERLKKMQPYMRALHQLSELEQTLYDLGVVDKLGTSTGDSTAGRMGLSALERAVVSHAGQFGFTFDDLAGADYKTMLISEAEEEL